MAQGKIKDQNKPVTFKENQVSKPPNKKNPESDGYTSEFYKQFK